MPRESGSCAVRTGNSVDDLRPVVPTECADGRVEARLPVFVLVVEDVAVKDRYNYEASVISVYDGDTVTLLVDLGFGTSTKQRFRLSRINTPEVRGPERERGVKSREYLRNLLPFGKTVGVRTIKDSQEKYGRYLAEVFDGEICINDLLVQAGMAEYHSY